MSEESFVPRSYLRFDGAGDFVTLPDLAIDWSQGLTIEAWVRYESCDTAARIVGFSESNGQSAITLSNVPGTLNLVGQTGSGQGASQVLKEGAIELGVWTHFALTISKGNVGKLYKNGVLVQTGTVGLPASLTRTRNYLGWSWDNESSFNGQLAEVRVWTTVRSDADILYYRSYRLTGSEAGLALYLPLDEDSGTLAYDRSPSGLHGVVTGATWVKEPVAPGTRSVLRFNGRSDSVKIGTYAEHKVEREITLEAWVHALSQRQWSGIVSRIYDSGTVESGYGLTLDGASGIWCGLRTVTGATNNFYFSSGANTLPLAQWHHVAATYDGDVVRIYVDGELKNKVLLASAIDYDPDNELTIGAYKDNDEFYPFSGRIAEVRIWKVARKLDELRATMNQSLRGDEEGLVGYWPLDDGNGDTARDRSRNGHSGKITGAVWELASVPFGYPPTAPAQPIDPQLVEMRARFDAHDQRLADIDARLILQAQRQQEEERAHAALEQKLDAQLQLTTLLQQMLDALSRKLSAGT